MANPSQFYYNRIAKASDYLHYWFVNSDNQNNLYSIISASKTQIGQAQLQAFKARQAAAFSSVGGGKVSQSQIDELGRVFDASVYQDALDDVLQTNNVESLADYANMTGDLEAAIASVKSITSENILGRLQNFADSVEQIIETQFSPANNQQTCREMGEQLFLQYAKEAGIMGQSRAVLTDNQRTKTAQHIIRSILDKSNRKLFNANDFQKSEQGITNTIKKFMLVVQALESFDGGSTGMSRATVVHGDGAKRTTSTANGEGEILSALAGKVYGAAKRLRAMSAEAAFDEAVLKGNKELIEKKLEVDSSISHVSGSEYFRVEVKVDENPIFQRLLNEINMSKAQLEKQVAKADVKFQVSEGGVYADLGFSIKSGKTVEIGTMGKTANITLQNRTALSTLLFREMGLSSQQYHAVLQLLVGHEEEGPQLMLDGMWEKLKEQILYMSLLSVFSGSSIGGQALFMVVADRIISISAIMNDIFMNPEAAYQLAFRDMTVEGGSLERGDYVATNTWIDPGRANPLSAETRSDTTWNAASNMLYNTKVSIMLNVLDLQNFINL